jgi:hypothetical protein
VTFLWLPKPLRDGVVNSGGAFTPTQVSAVSVWFRNSTVGALTTYPDVLGGAGGTPGPGGAGVRPTGNADLSVTFDGGDSIRVALAAVNNNATTWGFGCWIKADLGAIDVIYDATTNSGASSNKTEIQINTNGSLTTSNLTSGTATASAGSLVAATAAFLSIEYNGNRAAGSRFKFFVNGVDRTASDTAPAVLNAPTGNSEIGARDGSGSVGFNGTIGRNFYFYAAEMAGSTVGLLTTAARAALQTFEPLA